VTISSVSLVDFRCFDAAHVTPDPDGLTVLHGANGTGKTSVLEAIGWLATLRSIRGASRETVVRRGAERAILRSELSTCDRDAVIELEIRPDRPVRAQVNRQNVRRRTELAAVLRVSVFSPSDRQLVDGGPSERRDFLDDVLSERHPRLETLVDEVRHVLRQRAALLRQCSGRLDQSALSTLDVWDSRLATAGTHLVEAREHLVEELTPFIAFGFERLSGRSGSLSLEYRRSWEGSLLDALQGVRHDDLYRQVTSVGPHRDEIELLLDLYPARTHGSQGDQRCIALALRLASHELRRRGSPEPPVLLLDDVFSELDPRRCEALVELLPPGQVLLTTAVAPPEVVTPDRVVEVAAATASSS
jgi:DNA replication and repair protein RecF